MSNREDNIYQLMAMFPHIPKRELITQLDRNSDNFERTVDALLNWQPEDRQPEPVPPHVPLPATPQVQLPPFESTQEELSRQRNIETVHNMFGGELTKSVISTVYLQNHGDLDQTVVTLLNISHDDEAIQAIRAMSPDQKKKYEDDMKREQEVRLNERKERLEREIESDRKWISDMEKKFKEEEERHLQAMNEKFQKERVETPAKESPPEVELKKEELNLRNIVADQAKEIERKKETLAHKELLVSKLMQQAALCTLSVRYAPKTVVVSWSLGEDMKALPNDWVGFYKVGLPDTQYRKAVKTNGARQGHEHFPAPKTPGLYHFRYFVNGSYDILATSDVIHIGPQILLNTKLVEDENPKKNIIEVEYTLRGGDLSPDDWFGIYKATETNNKNYLMYHKLGKQLSSSSFQFPAPRLPGDYVVRFFPYLCGYTHVTKSPLIRIPNKDKLVLTMNYENERVKTIEVKWDILSIEPSTSDYIALYASSSFNNYYLSYKYIDMSSHTLFFEAPLGVGKYNLRYHHSGFSKYVDLVRSEDFEILNTDKLNVKVDGKTVTVSWDVHSQPVTSWDWIGVFKKDHGNNNKNYLEFKYVDIATKALIFVINEPGEYIAKYFSSKVGKYEDFRSIPFAINQ